MKIAIAADHAGFALEGEAAAETGRRGPRSGGFRHQLSAESCDYPDFAQPVAREVAAGRADRGILVCSTGIGMAMAANKVAGVRAAPAQSEDEVRLTREHNDANVLTLGAKYLDEDRARGTDPHLSEHRIRRRPPRAPGGQDRAAGTVARQWPAVTDGPHGGRSHDGNTANVAAPGRGGSRKFTEAIQHEVERQHSQLELIASENFTSEAVLEATGQRLHQQVRRRLSRQALLRRLRVHRHRGEPGPRPRQEAVRRRVRQRAAAFRLAGQPGRLRRGAARPATPSWG